MIYFCNFLIIIDNNFALPNKNFFERIKRASFTMEAKRKDTEAPLIV